MGTVIGLVIGVVVLWVGCALWAGRLAGQRGHDRTLWLVRGLYMGPATVRFARLLPDLREREPTDLYQRL